MKASFTLIQCVNEAADTIHGHSTVEFEGSFYIFGGSAGGSASDRFYQFNLKNRSWTLIPHKGTPPPVSSDHAAFVYKRWMYVFGGRGHASKRNGVPTGFPQPLYNHLFRFSFDSRTWEDLSSLQSGQIPSPRKAFGHVQMEISNEHCAVIWSGWNNIDFFDDMFSLSFETLKWSKISQKEPLPNKRHDCSFLLRNKPNGKKSIILYGGAFGFGVCFNSLMEFDFETQSWSELPPIGKRPEATEAHGAILMENRWVVLYGGHNGKEFFNSVFIYDLEKKEWSEIESEGNVPMWRACFTFEPIYLNSSNVFNSKSEIENNNNNHNVKEFNKHEGKEKIILIGGYGPDRGGFIPAAETNWHRYKDVYLLELKD